MKHPRTLVNVINELFRLDFLSVAPLQQMLLLRRLSRARRCGAGKGRRDGLVKQNPRQRCRGLFLTARPGVCFPRGSLKRFRHIGAKAISSSAEVSRGCGSTAFCGPCLDQSSMALTFLRHRAVTPSGHACGRSSSWVTSILASARSSGPKVTTTTWSRL